MEIVNNQISLIEKEEISKFIFPKEEVIQDAAEILLRTENLAKGLKLGNNYKGKVEILFEDNTSIKKVETTVWGVTEKYIILKGDILIPIKRIHSISF